MKILRYASYFLLWTLLLLFFTTCSDEDDSGKGRTQVPALIQKVNTFIFTYFDDAYLWNKTLPREIDYRYENDPYQYFDTLVYKPDDRWSYLTEDAASLFENYEGVGTTFGYEFALGEFTNLSARFAIVLYTYPNSPAEKAGLKRGDLIIKMNNGYITAENYKSLFSAPSIELELGKLTENGINSNGQKISMQAVKMYLDPINTWKIIERNHHKIGYLCYTDYVPDSHEKLVEIFSEFKNQGVKDVVLDLRYNSGGAAVTATYLSSILAPARAIREKSVFLKELWNEKYMAHYQSQHQDVNRYFDNQIPVNMDLSKLYVLTTQGTASASEATIAGLSSYLNVVKIGTATHGKYCGAALIQPWTDNQGNVDPEIANWAMSLIVYRFANKDGLTDFKNGFAPDYLLQDDLWNTYPFGDERDPQLAKALELICGEKSPAAEPARLRSIPSSVRIKSPERILRYPWQGQMTDLRLLSVRP